MTITIDIDTGGTFTDGFVVCDGEPQAVKVLTTPHDLAVCFAEVIEAAAAALGLDVPAMLAETSAVRYATTVGTNAVIQRSGPRLGLLTDSEDAGSDASFLLDSGMKRLVAIADPAPAGNGADPDTTGAVRELLEASARGLVCSMSSAEAELAVAAEFRERYPRQCLDTVPLVLAGDLTSDQDDRRRAATALFNAYLHPAVADYYYRAEDYLRDNGYRRPLLVVHNDGGCARVAKTIAAKTYNSGPTAGAAGAAAVARALGIETLVTLDMGGTSLDVTVIRDGAAPVHERGLVEGVELSLPLPDLVTLGAGGGSIAHVADGELRVGPQSAGAKPGPACFGFGGIAPTVTDADVVLGIIRPETFLGGSMKIDANAAHAALEELGSELGGSAEETAERVLETVHEQMGSELASRLADAGIEPADATMLAFGGNGATHAAGIAEHAGVPEILTFAFSPVFSAFGASTSDVRHIYEMQQREGAEQELRERALRDMRGEGFATDEVEIATRTAGANGSATLILEAVRRMPHLAIETGDVTVAAADPATKVEVRWPGSGSAPTGIYDGESLAPGATLAGPALVESSETTCAVPPGWSLRVDEYGASRMRREEDR